MNYPTYLVGTKSGRVFIVVPMKDTEESVRELTGDALREERIHSVVKIPSLEKGSTERMEVLEG